MIISITSNILVIPLNKLTNYYPPLYLQIFDGNAVLQPGRKKPNIKTKKEAPFTVYREGKYLSPKRSSGRKKEEL